MFFNRKTNASLASVISSCVRAIKRILSKYRTRIIFSLLKMDIGTFMNFVKTFGAGKKLKHR